MQGKHAADHGADVNCEHHVVILGCKTADKILAVQVGQKVDDFLKKEHYFVVCWQLAVPDVPQVLDNLLNLALKSLQSLHFLEDTTLERIQRDFLDFPE